MCYIYSMNTLNHFEKINSLLEEKGLCDNFFLAAQEHIDAVSGLLHTSPVQTALFALFLDHFGEYSVAIDNLAGTLNCKKIQLIRYMDDLDELKHKKLIRETSNCRDYRKENWVEYTIPLDVINSLRKGIEYKVKPIDNLSPNDFYDYADDLFSALFDDDIDRNMFDNELKGLYEYNKEICFVKKLREYNLDDSSELIMLNLCCALVSRDVEKMEMSDFTQFISHQDYRNFQRGLKSQEHELFKKDFVHYDFEKGFINTEYCLLSEKAKKEFLSDVVFREKPKQKEKILITADKIPVKKLFYNEKLKGRIGELTTLLQEDKFTDIQKRLTENNMHTGFACIFSGPPGTGKTETAYQMAHETGRDIMPVNISETKSCWFGESEKLIKETFDRYRSLVQEGGPVPILLFNEADGVLGKRREISNRSGGVDQTENAIQNIILQEMEDLNGILIATTNMTANLDKAFERRFLYKIEFEKPDIESKRLIWQSLIPNLQDEDAVKLAEKYDFSGGQIENIARKCVVANVLKNMNPGLSDLEIFCKEELVEKYVAKIGFQA